MCKGRGRSCFRGGRGGGGGGARAPRARKATGRTALARRGEAKRRERRFGCFFSTQLVWCVCSLSLSLSLSLSTKRAEGGRDGKGLQRAKEARGRVCRRSRARLRGAPAISRANLQGARHGRHHPQRWNRAPKHHHLRETSPTTNQISINHTAENTRAVPSSEPLSTCRPSGENATSCTGPSCPLSLRTTAPVRRSQRRTRPSRHAVATTAGC
jgi:hypothetical protein